MKAPKKISSLLAFCAVLALASSAQLSYAKSGTAIYTTEVTEKAPPKEERGTAAKSFVAKASLSQTPPARLFSISLEAKGSATVSQSYTSPVVVTNYAHWTQSGGDVVVTFNPEDGKRPVTFSRSGNRLVAKVWNAADWSGAAPPAMHRESEGAQTAAASSGRHFSFHF